MGTIRGETFRMTADNRGQEVGIKRAVEVGEGYPTLLARASAFPSWARKGPPAFRQEGRHACWGRSCICTLGEIGCESGDVARLHVNLSISRFLEAFFSRGRLW